MLTYEWLQQVLSYLSIQTSTYLFATKLSGQIPDGYGWNLYFTLKKDDLISKKKLTIVS